MTYIEDEASVAFTLKITKERRRRKRAKSEPAFCAKSKCDPLSQHVLTVAANVHSHSMWLEWKN